MSSAGRSPQGCVYPQIGRRDKQTPRRSSCRRCRRRTFKAGSSSRLQDAQDRLSVAVVNEVRCVIRKKVEGNLKVIGRDEVRDLELSRYSQSCLRLSFPFDAPPSCHPGRPVGKLII